jgi:hypothetical protein
MKVIKSKETKYMASGKACKENMPPSLTVGDYTFERVELFKYLGSTVTYSNDTSYEWRRSVGPIV